MRTTSLLLLLAANLPAAFTLQQVKSYPFPNELAASAAGSKIAWAFNEQGRRNIWVAEGPDFKARRLTSYQNDDGQELTSVSISRDGRYVVYVRGGEHGSNWETSSPVNPASSTTATPVQIWSVPFSGGEPKLLAGGDSPVISPQSNTVAYEQERAIWTVPIDGARPAKRLFSAKGELGDPVWSPDGSRLAFVANRGGHSFIGVWSGEANAILWLAPSTSRDSSPRWSPDGTRIAFTRRAGAGGVPEPILVPRPVPWSIWTADASSGEGRQIWKSGTTLRDSPPSTHGGTNLHWAAKGRIVFLSYADGWPHLYSVAENGGPALLLTPGRFMCEMISLSPDGTYLLASANSGPGPDDIDRRHILKIPVDTAAAVVLTPGNGSEWSPQTTGDGSHIVFLGATSQRPPLPMVIAASGGAARTIAEETIPATFPTAQLVIPKRVVFRSPDGLDIHGQLFEPAPGGAAKKPAIVYIHGGPPRQMLLGWHYSDYYANAYASNQYLASRGFVVLSVNYRLGIGYGFEFHRPPNAGAQGAAEYKDILAAGRYLQTLPNVDARRIGVYGGSYGGYLTALALARNSDVFAAGVDIHGVHDLTAERARAILAPAYEKAPDIQKALDIAWASSPVSAISTWKSPVLLIHADDDRNVRFSQTVDLVQRLEKAGVRHEVIVIPDDTHHFLRHANWLKVNAATAAFFERLLLLQNQLLHHIPPAALPASLDGQRLAVGGQLPAVQHGHFVVAETAFGVDHQHVALPRGLALHFVRPELVGGLRPVGLVGGLPIEVAVVGRHLDRDLQRRLLVDVFLRHRRGSGKLPELALGRGEFPIAAEIRLRLSRSGGQTETGRQDQHSSAGSGHSQSSFFPETVRAYHHEDL